MLQSFKQWLLKFDANLFSHVQQFTNDGNTSIMVVITFFASQNFLLPANIILGLYFLLVRKDKWSCIKFISINLSSYLVMSSLKLYFHRVRPMHPVHNAAIGFSFPSGHAMSSVTFYGLLIYFVFTQVKNNIIKWLLTILLLLMILLIGFSRVYLRLHFGSDVLAGYFFGLIWLMISLFIFRKIQHGKLNETNA